MADIGHTRRDGVYVPLTSFSFSPAAALSADAYSGAVELGGPRGVTCVLTVTSVSTDDTLDVTIQGSSTGAFGGEETTLATFTQATGATAERKSFVGDRFIRAKYDVTGSSVSIACTLTGEYC